MNNKKENKLQVIFIFNNYKKDFYERLMKLPLLESLTF